MTNGIASGNTPHPLTTAPRLSAVAPILLVQDVVRSAAYWRDAAGFSFDRLWGEPPAFVMLRRDGLTLMLQQAPHGHVITPHWKIVGGMWNVYFWVKGVDALYQEFRERGAIIDYAIGDKPYGCREFGIRDLDDHDVAFGEVMRESESDGAATDTMAT